MQAPILHQALQIMGLEEGVRKLQKLNGSAEMNVSLRIQPVTHPTANSAPKIRQTLTQLFQPQLQFQQGC
jgi:hypothetical protein